MPSPEELPAWRLLARLRERGIPDAAAMGDRFGKLAIRLPGLLADFSKQCVDDEILAALLQLADESALVERREQMFRGETINSTEGRPALHTALRAAAEDRPAIARDSVEETLARMAQFAGAIGDGRHRGYSGKAITDIVHIGIGGSHLGPELAVEALRQRHAPNCHFVANVDGSALRAALDGRSPDTTLFVVASKSFSTLETQVNANSARSWFLERTGDIAALEHHFVGVTANVEAAAAFGIARRNIYPMWDWVGGRYSLWSAVGLPILLAAGTDAFTSLLQGARAVDEHFRTAPPERNVPLLMALIGLWNYNFLGAETQAILPYDHRLRLLPSYLQQLEMESNGKSVHLDGSPVAFDTMPVVWGGEGTNGQHAFHQLLHQGTRRFAADFVLVADADHGLPLHQRWLLANGLAQSQAMLLGHVDADPHRAVPGRKPTTTLVLDSLSPRSLGALLALYEHKAFCQGAIWNINSFDQWGVELGKRLAIPIFEQLGGHSAAAQDSSTRGLVAYVRARPGIHSVD